MGIAKGHVSHRNRAAMRPWHTQFIFGNGNVPVGKSGAANRAKVIELYDEPLAHPVEIRNVFERAPLALLCALSVPGVKKRKMGLAVAFPRDRRADAAIHSAAQKDHRFSCVAHILSA